MLGDAPVFPTIPCVDLEASRKFYGETLGLKEASLPGLDEGVAETSAFFECGQGTMLFIYLRPEPSTADNTAANWMVADIDAVVDELINRGVKLEVYEMPGVEYDARGVSSMGEMRGAWIKDPDGNILSLTQAP